jgi:hypothetical protein
MPPNREQARIVRPLSVELKIEMSETVPWIEEAGFQTL